MFKGTVTVTSNTDKRAQILQTLKNLINTEVLVGITEENSSRPGERVTNAELLFIHTNGSPLKGIPARPVIEPAIENNKDKVAELLGKAAKQALHGDELGARQSLESAGMYGQKSARDWFTNPNNGWAPNSEYTIVEKLRKQGRASGENGKLARDIVRHVDEGGKLSDITGIEGMVDSLIDTDEMRKSITYVIRDKN